MLERLDEAASFFGGKWYRRVFTPYVLRSIVFISDTTRLKKKSYTVEGGSRLHELKGRTKVMPSTAARGDRKLGAVGCRGPS